MVPPTSVALLIIDVQRDFCTGGPLPVPNGDAVVPVLNNAITACIEANILIYASRDWHPSETRHFKAKGGTWPTHCVAGTLGAEFHPQLCLPPNTIVVSKGQGPTADGYSAFEGTTASGEPFRKSLHRLCIRRLLVGGLATDYCVRHTVLDALRAGFQVMVGTDAIAGVNLATGDSTRALEEMRIAGAEITRSLLKLLNVSQNV